MSALMVSQVEVLSPALFQEYLEKSKAIAGPLGAELIVRGRFAESLNGEPQPHHLLMIAKFPTIEAIETWFGCDEYKAIVPLRDRGSNQTISVYSMLED